ncbi:unnamed protein product [Ilex paraguariensis]|uniref:Beta-glucosidase n=1 Tax=Ilex paraguariensis TaxID=185542 RepID=A0ABC8RB32_9AQUA
MTEMPAKSLSVADKTKFEDNYRLQYFAIYAETCFASFGDRVKKWITLNEPHQSAVNGYCTGIYAPGRREHSSTEPYLVAYHQLLAHAEAVSIYRDKFKVFSVFFI